MKVVINRCYGGFGLSKKAIEMYCEKKAIDPGVWNEFGYYDNFYDGHIDRSDSDLIEIVEQLGDKANGNCANLTIVDVPDNVNWYISDYDGKEHVSEVHRTWY